MLCFFAFFTISKAVAQSVLINPLHDDQISLSSEQEQNLENLISSGVYSVVEPVTVNYLALDDATSLGTLALGLDAKLGCSPLVKLETYTIRENGDRHYEGTVVHGYDEDGEPLCECDEGFAWFYQTDSTFSGAIHIDDRKFELRDISEGTHLFAERKETTIASVCGVGEEVDDPGSLPEMIPNSSSLESRTRCHPVRVLVLFDQTALDNDPNIQATSAELIDHMSRVAVISGAFTSQVSFELAGVEQFDSGTTGDAGADITALNNNLGVQALRDLTDADVVLYLVDARWRNNGDDVLGIAFVVLNPDLFMAAVDVSSDLRTTTTHELGHLLGCRHQIADDPTGPFEHAFEFKTGCWPFKKERQTIMWATAENSIINRFSNPNREWRNEAYGSPTENNALMLRSQGCTVANFNTSNGPPLVSAFIDGPGIICACTQDQIEVQVSCPPGITLTYAWRQSSDGVNYGPIIGTDATLDVAAPCDPGDIFWYRAEVFSAGQLLTTVAKSVMADPFPPIAGPNACPQLILDVSQPTAAIQPTITNGDLTLSISNTFIDHQLEVIVTSVTGQQFPITLQTPSGKYHQIPITLPELSQGVYFLSSPHFETLKFIHR